MAREYRRSISWVQKQIFEYEPSHKTHNPRGVNLVCDAILWKEKAQAREFGISVIAIEKDASLIQKNIHALILKSLQFL